MLGSVEGRTDFFVEALEEGVLDFRVPQDADPPGGELNRHLFTGREGLGFGDHLVGPDDPPLGGKVEGAFRFESPEGTKAQGIDGEDRFVPVSGDDGRRALGQGAEKAPVEKVHGLALVIEGRDDVGDGRKEDFHGFDQAEPELDHEPFKGPVEVLGVASACDGGDPEHGGFPAELVDGVDLAVVTEDGKGLDALRHRKGIGRIAAVAQNEGSLALRVLEVEEVVGEDEARSFDLVDDDRRGEGGDVQESVPLEAGAGLEGGVKRIRSRRGQKGHLPEVRLVVREGGDPPGEGLAPSDHQDLESLFRKDLFDEGRLVVGMVASQVEMAGHEPGIVDEAPIPPFLLEPAPPERFWDVHLDAAPVPLVPDLPGPVLHLLEGFEGFMEQAVRSASGFGKDGNDRTAVPLLLGEGAGEARNRFPGRGVRQKVGGLVLRGIICHLVNLRWVKSERNMGISCDKGSLSLWVPAWVPGRLDGFACRHRFRKRRNPDGGSLKELSRIGLSGNYTRGLFPVATILCGFWEKRSFRKGPQDISSFFPSGGGPFRKGCSPDP